MPPSPSSSSLLQFRGQMLRRLHIGNAPKKWSIKQLNKSNLTDSLRDLKTRIFHSDFIAISLQNTGSFSASWHRNLPFDTSQIAYFKAKHAAENFQTLQFAVCPFSIAASDVVAHPFNFHLFPRDELNVGMPTYTFSCQVSYLTSMARDDFDFNACINDGISYLSRAQESVAKLRLGKAPQRALEIKSSSIPTVADSIFIERVKSRIKHWKDACKTSSKTNDEMLGYLKKLILGNDIYGSRPCMNVDVCSERQVQLVLELSRDAFSDLVSIVVPAKSGGSTVVCFVLTSSKEDKELLERDLQNVEVEENRRLRGFREVIELIAASKKPVVSFNSLHDFTFIHSKFLAPLPPTMDKFSCSLDSVFPLVFDLLYLMSDIGPLSKMTNAAGALSYLKDHFFAPVNFEIPDLGNEGEFHGHDVVNVCHLFAKICSIRKISTHEVHSDSRQLLPAFEEYANNFSSFTNAHVTNENIVRVWAKNKRKISTEPLVFLWGFADGMTSQTLKALFQGSHIVFNEEFDVRLVDKSCAILVFWNPGLSKIFMGAMNIGCISASLMEIVSEGLIATDYETYKNTCKLGLWETNLADSLAKVLANSNFHLEADLETSSAEIHQCNDSFINLDDL